MAFYSAVTDGESNMAPNLGASLDHSQHRTAPSNDSLSSLGRSGSTSGTYIVRDSTEPRGRQGFGTVAAIRSPVKGAVGLLHTGRGQNGAPPFNCLGKAVDMLAASFKLHFSSRPAGKAISDMHNMLGIQRFHYKNNILPYQSVLLELCVHNTLVCE